MAWGDLFEQPFREADDIYEGCSTHPAIAALRSNDDGARFDLAKGSRIFSRAPAGP